MAVFSSPVAMIAGTKQAIVDAASLAQSVEHRNGTTAHNITFPALGNVGPEGNEAEAVSDALLSILPGAIMHYEFLRQFLLLYTPVFLLTTINSAVPFLLRMASTLQGYTQNSVLELSVFRKTVFYVVLNSVVLPSVAMDTASELALLFYRKSKTFDEVFLALPVVERVFSGDMAFFLCNFIVQLTGTGNLLALLRLPAAVQRAWRRRRVVTPLELAEAKCAEPFDFGYNYAANIAVMCMCLLFGGVAPIIWCFALPFFITKYFVDVFNLRFVHPQSYLEGSLHRDAASFIVLWCVASQLVLAGMFYSRAFNNGVIIMVSHAFPSQFSRRIHAFRTLFLTLC
uniref:CSC1/OSCA1-like 7TM region domain-containing protein n=1 Tax=Timspurckia oligopyrenoides TaxID=708627 RepID=A0A7S1ESK4_9RHOD